jgi:hypothetical protein
MVVLVVLSAGTSQPLFVLPARADRRSDDYSQTNEESVEGAIASRRANE